MFLPSEILARVYMMALSTVLLPAARPTIWSASRMGTPEESMVPRVRVKRATATLRASGPKSGSLRTVASQTIWPFFVRMAVLKAKKMPVGMPAKRYQLSMRPCERSTRNWVGAGSVPPKSLNIFSKVGVTKPSSAPTTPTATTSTMVG